MSLLSIKPRSAADARLGSTVERFARRVEAMPPGICPVVAQAALLHAGAAQTCGKCVPCRDGLPRLAAMADEIAACEAGEDALERCRALAEMIRDTSDCAIGYEAAAAFLDALDQFADEFAAHIEQRRCADGVGQSVPCETMCPAHVDAPGYIALVAEGPLRRRRQHGAQGQPVPHGLRVRVRAPLRGALPAHPDRRARQHPRHQALRGRRRAPPTRWRRRRAAWTRRARSPSSAAAPSGLTCAYFLALMGHRVTVFEARDQLGGMMRYGIPAYRFPRERLDEDIRGILGAGTITIRCGERVDAVRMREIADTYHAVYVAIGAQKGKTLDMPRLRCRGA